MSTPPRRRSRRLASASTAAPSPDTPPPTRLLDLPTELLVRALSRCDPADIARVAAVSLLFHASLAREGIRLWARERGFELPALKYNLPGAPFVFRLFSVAPRKRARPLSFAIFGPRRLQAPSPRSHTHVCGQAAQLGAAKQGIPEPDARAESWGFRSG